MWTCSSCQAENEDYSLFCKKCNTAKPSAAAASPPAASPATTASSAAAAPAPPSKAAAKAPYVAVLSDYLRGSAMASLLETMGKVFLYAGIAIGVLLIFVVGAFGKDGYNFLLGLTGGLCAFGAFFFASLLLRGLSGMIQSAENTENMLRYWLEKTQEASKAKAS